MKKSTMNFTTKWILDASEDHLLIIKINMHVIQFGTSLNILVYFP